MDERINILIGSDINYAPYYGVMLTSLFINNKESQFDVYLLTDSTWTEKETKKFDKLCEKYRSRFIVKVVDEEILKDFPRIPHISLPTYYRLQASNLLPHNIDKILYLDGDMIVCGDIRPLWNTNIDRMAFAGVDDCAAWEDIYYTRIGIERAWGYFNAGVSLYNLNYWRENNLSEVLMTYIAENKDKVPLMDQDAVNTLLKDKKVRISKVYNLQTWAYLKTNWDGYTEEEKQLYMEAAKNPIIIHYSGWYKPWDSRKYYGMPFYYLWRSYWKISQWKNANKLTPVGKYLKFCIKRITGFKLLDNRNQLFIPESYDLA